MKKSSYLSERQYESGSACDGEYSGQRSEYWKRILGEKTFQYVLDNSREFGGYLRQAAYTLREDGKEQNAAQGLPERLMEYVRLAEGRKDRVSYEEFGVHMLKERIGCAGDFFAAGIYSDFAAHLKAQLQAVYMRSFIVNLHESKRAGKLKGATSKEEYDYFCRHIADDAENVKAQLKRYPVLCRCLAEKTGQMADYYEEVLRHFQKDREEISEKLCGGRKTGRIVKISGNFSDVHNQGRQVLKVGLDNGEELLYKPRSMENEEWHRRLLGQISQMTGSSQYEYPFLSYKDHGWSTIVRYKTCESEEGLKRYYQRLGEQIFLAYLLGTKDLHSENIIAGGEYPVLIDLETLVNITFNRRRETAGEEICYQLAQSVLYTGLLPFYSWNYDGGGVNVSAISGAQGQAYPFKVPRIVKEGTSEMYIDYGYPESVNGENLATVRGEFVSPSRYKKELLEGFRKAYGAVMGQKDEFHSLLEGMRKTESRYLLADTQRYAMLLSGSFHPSLLEDGADRELFFWTLCDGRRGKDADIVKSEVKSLLLGDVPYFSYRLDETALRGSGGEEFEDYFERPAVKILHERLDGLCRDDRDRQCGYIALALALMPENGEECMNHVYPAPKTQGQESGTEEKKIAKVCRELTDRLLKYAVWNRDGTQVSWFKVRMSDCGKHTWNIAPMGMYLYDGLAGMLLLFSALGKTDGRKEVRRIAKTLESMVFGYTDAGMASLNRLVSKNTGAYEGESSILYTYLLLYRQTGSSRYIEYARRHAEIIEKLLKDDDKYDLLAGNAGAALALLKLYKVTGDKNYLGMAESAVNVLGENAEEQEEGIGWVVERGFPPMEGMAHGNSGFLMAAAGLWKATGREKYRKLAEKIWAYEDTLYDPEINNWRDVRDGSRKEPQGPVAWCHGAAGILLSRLYCYRNACTQEWKELMRKDMERAYGKVKNFWLRDSFSLCHGTCGNLWILKEAAKEMEDEPVRHEIAGRVKLLPQERINPGLMSGYGGVLYYFLSATI